MKKSNIVLAIVLALAVFIFIYSRIVSNNLLVVLSESMKPTINMGDLIITAPTDSNNIKVGDIVAFENGKVPITHRIINITESGFTTKGDANEDPDIHTRSKSSVLGKVVFWIPLAGYLVYFARSFYGFIILIVIPGILLIITEARNIINYIKEDKSKNKKSRRLYSSIFIVILSFLLISVTSIESSGHLSGAYFSDIEEGQGSLNAGIWGFSEFDKIKVSGPDEVCLYERIEWVLKIIVSNKLLTPMDNIIVTDVLPGEVELVDYTVSQGILTTEVKGKSTHLTWDIGTLEPCNTAELTLTIATRLNPSGKKYEFTTPGTYDLNEGALLTWDGGSTGPTAPITVVAVDCEPEINTLEINNETNTTNSTSSLTDILLGGGSMGSGGDEEDTEPPVDADVKPPQYSNESINGTQADTWINHNVLWTDDNGLSGYIFSFDNCLGEFVNDTWVEFNESWSTVTKLTNSTINCTVNWMVYANDTSDNWNFTEVFSYVNENITEENVTENETIYYYNYSDTVNNKINYYYNESYNESSGEYPLASIDPDYGQEANSSEYSTTLNYEGGTCDNNNCFEYTFTNNETNKTVWHSFIFKINQNVSNIKSINISWAGYAETNSTLIDGKFRILTNDSYEDISNIATENQVYNYNIDSNFENYLNSTGHLRFQVWALTNNLSDSIRLWTDYVMVVVKT